MPIILKSVADARRAAAAAADAKIETANSPRPEMTPVPPQDGRSDDVPDAGKEADPTVPAARPKRRGHAVKDENGRWQPTDAYASGFARPPKDTQFKPGGKPGPGRPKGSVSHDTLWAKYLNEKREVTVNGRRRKVANREIIIMATMKSAMEGTDKQARAHALAQDQRLHPSRANAETEAIAALSETDALILAQYEEELMERLRADMKSGSAGDGREGLTDQVGPTEPPV